MRVSLNLRGLSVTEFDNNFCGVIFVYLINSSSAYVERLLHCTECSKEPS